MSISDYEKDHFTRVREAGAECMVLLKKDGALPVEKPGTCALYGNGARRTLKGGTGSGNVNSNFYTTAEKGLENAGFAIVTKAWLDGYDEVQKQAHKKFVEDIRLEAKKQHVQAVFLGMGAVMPEPEYQLPVNTEADLGVYVLSRVCGEGNDRRCTKGDYLLTDTEIRDIHLCAEKYQKFVLVLNAGGPVDLSPVMDVPNILLLSQLGAPVGDVLGDVLTGKSCPSGKLTASWVKAQDIISIGDFGERDDTQYKEGIFVGYRYYDTAGKEPLFPFGYGLSYTEFETECREISAEGSAVTIKADVTNTGKFPGKEIVQIYVSVPSGKLPQPYQRLAGFKKTKALQPGEKEEVTISFEEKDLASFDEEAAAYLLEAGNYIVRIGNDSRHTKVCGLLHLDHAVHSAATEHAGGHPDFKDWVPEIENMQEEIPDNLPVIQIDPSALDHMFAEVPAFPSAEALQKAESLSDEELCNLAVGAYKDGPGFMSVIGNASSKVAGAAGESCGKVTGIPSIVMADGPAGLRLSKEYYVDQKGAHPVGETLPAGISEFMLPFLVKLMGQGGRKPKGEVHTQYCTAIPIATAIAQSWNPEVGKICGDIVGAEMERFHVQLWLAPAINIQRHPLCGRNFEYYSEDPLLSGIFGAAVTEGVQQHKGCGVTVKHFTANNQETNRYQSNSCLSERALREIYMKPFEICLRKADPCALMNSYNLVNGSHTSERGDLINVVRKEWGWKGLIVTDWIVAGNSSKTAFWRVERAAETAAAGTNAFMPGSSANYKDILNARKGKNPAVTFSRKQAETGAAYVIDTVWKLTGK